jgi:hypothetical protein
MQVRMESVLCSSATHVEGLEQQVRQVKALVANLGASRSDLEAQLADSAASLASSQVPL